MSEKLYGIDMDSRSLYHHGIKGQKWGVRRFENKDGTYTAAGKKRYGNETLKDAKKHFDTLYKFSREARSKKLSDYSEDDHKKSRSIQKQLYGNSELNSFAKKMRNLQDLKDENYRGDISPAEAEKEFANTMRDTINKLYPGLELNTEKYVFVESMLRSLINVQREIDYGGKSIDDIFN